MHETTIRTEIDIDAPPARVWQVLTDLAGYRHWNPMVTSAEGDAAEGRVATLHYRSRQGVPLRFEVRIIRFDRERELRWMGSRLGITADHYFQLSARGTGTHLEHGEVFRGALTGPFGFAIRSQLPVFELFNHALKSTAEMQSDIVAGTRPAMAPRPTDDRGPPPR